MTEREKIIAKLVDEGKITGEQAILLLKINEEKIEHVTIDGQTVYLDELH